MRELLFSILDDGFYFPQKIRSYHGQLGVEVGAGRRARERKAVLLGSVRATFQKEHRRCQADQVSIRNCSVFNLV